MEHKWGAIALIGILLALGSGQAYDKYLKHQLEMAKIEHSCTVTK